MAPLAAHPYGRCAARPTQLRQQRG